MICPYAVSRMIVTQTTFEYEEDVQTAQQTIEQNKAEFIPCAEKNCGAWYDGRCQYRGTE